MALSIQLPQHLFTPTLLLLLLGLALCAAASALQSADGGAAQNEADADSAVQTRLTADASSLAQLLRGRRSAELQAPPHYYSRLAAGYFGSVPSKRDDGYWIWMPAHGYMSVPRDEVAASSGDKDSMGNLLRYGRK